MRSQVPHCVACKLNVYTIYIAWPPEQTRSSTSGSTAKIVRCSMRSRKWRSSAAETSFGGLSATMQKRLESLPTRNDPRRNEPRGAPTPGALTQETNLHE